MINPPYKFGLVVGRFQGFHTGHANMIKQALSICQEVLLFIGSSQESGTQKNPFSFEFRKNIIETVFCDEVHKGRLVIKPLPDIGVGNNTSWGKYVLDNVASLYDEYPDVFISAKEERRVSWFDGEEVDMVEVYVPKKINISGTEMREDLLNNNEKKWQQYTPWELWQSFASQKAFVLESQNNSETASL